MGLLAQFLLFLSVGVGAGDNRGGLQHVRLQLTPSHPRPLGQGRKKSVGSWWSIWRPPRRSGLTCLRCFSSAPTRWSNKQLSSCRSEIA